MDSTFRLSVSDDAFTACSPDTTMPMGVGGAGWADIECVMFDLR